MHQLSWRFFPQLCGLNQILRSSKFSSLNEDPPAETDPGIAELTPKSKASTRIAEASRARDGCPTVGGCKKPGLFLRVSFRGVQAVPAKLFLYFNNIDVVGGSRELVFVRPIESTTDRNTVVCSVCIADPSNIHNNSLVH